MYEILFWDCNWGAWNAHRPANVNLDAEYCVMTTVVLKQSGSR